MILCDPSPDELFSVAVRRAVLVVVVVIPVSFASVVTEWSWSAMEIPVADELTVTEAAASPPFT